MIESIHGWSTAKATAAFETIMLAWSAFCVALNTNLMSDLSLPAPSNVPGLADPVDIEAVPPAAPVHLLHLDLMDNPIMDGECDGFQSSVWQPRGLNSA